MTQGRRYERQLNHGGGSFTQMGSGEVGGKAAGLVGIQQALESRFPDGCFPGGCSGGLRVDIPRMTVLATDLFEQFVESNDLGYLATAQTSDDQIALQFQRGELAPHVVGDLLTLISGVHEPLAIRSSSLLEDAVHAPFAGVYETKMIPNNQPEPESRFRRLVEAIKFVYASTYFRQARDYFRAIGRDIHQERMAVIIQEVVGARFGERFYPTVSGVARSYNFYPTGNAKPREGVVSLALGLGKTIVDGGRAWSYCPAWPQAPPPYSSIEQLLQNTQAKFWAVSMATPREYDPVRETEYLEHLDLEAAELDGTLRHVCSTYDPQSDRLAMGLAGGGPRLVDFSPILKGRQAPLNELVRLVLQTAEESAGTEVEIEFALAFDPEHGRESRFGFLQVRGLAAAAEGAVVEIGEVGRQEALIFCRRVMGNGELAGIRDVVYVRPDAFRAAETPRIAMEVEKLNARLLENRTPYLLVGFGRWGSADPWLGIPVAWGQISGARVIVEATAAQMSPDLSQGSHFFHNLTGLGVLFFAIQDEADGWIDWDWLAAQAQVQQGPFVRHVRCARALTVRADGRQGRGVVLK
jgi:hypothetical protein